MSTIQKAPNTCANIGSDDCALEKLGGDEGELGVATREVCGPCKAYRIHPNIKLPHETADEPAVSPTTKRTPDDCAVPGSPACELPARIKDNLAEFNNWTYSPACDSCGAFIPRETPDTCAAPGSPAEGPKEKEFKKHFVNEFEKATAGKSPETCKVVGSPACELSDDNKKRFREKPPRKIYAGLCCEACVAPGSPAGKTPLVVSTEYPDDCDAAGSPACQAHWTATVIRNAEAGSTDKACESCEFAEFHKVLSGEADESNVSEASGRDGIEARSANTNTSSSAIIKNCFSCESEKCYTTDEKLIVCEGLQLIIVAPKLREVMKCTAYVPAVRVCGSCYIFTGNNETLESGAFYCVAARAWLDVDDPRADDCKGFRVMENAGVNLILTDGDKVLRGKEARLVEAFVAWINYPSPFTKLIKSKLKPSRDSQSPG